MEVKIFKKTGTYFSKEKNKDVPFTNFYVQCNDQLIPIEVKYFPNPQFENRDPGYQGRFAVLSAFAEILPEKNENPRINPHKVECPQCKKVMRIDDRDGNEFYLCCDDCKIDGLANVKTGEISFTKEGEDLPF